MPSNAAKQLLPLIEIPGIQLLELLGEGKQSFVYKAEKNGALFAVKISRSQFTDVNQTILFRREAAFLASLQDDCLPKILDVGEQGDLSYFIQEFIEGQDLGSQIEKERLTCQEASQIAKKLCGALSKIHRFGLVHRDIKPKNILIHKNGNPYLIDLGLATRASEETISEDMAGTYIYSSPEQLGMIARPVDCRSDLYSMGILLFECVTGQPPFVANEVQQLVKMHASQKPPSILDYLPDFSSDFDNIVQKLLAKDPDDRYQDSAALLEDLNQLDENNSVLNKSLSEKSLSSKESISFTQLVGRHKGLELLKNFQKQAASKGGNVVLVSAPSGMGKTRLIRELLNEAGNEIGLVLTGKCVQSHNPLPFAPIREAIDDFLNRSKKLPQDAQLKIYGKIRQAMGEGFPLLKTFTPFMKEIFKDTSLSPSIANLTLEQFYSALAEFLIELPKYFRHVIFFIDDIQWLDEASRTVIRIAAQKINDKSLMIIASSREDVESEVQTKAFINELGDLLSTQIFLKPFSLEDTREMMVSQLGNMKVEETLIDLVHNRSGGIPFAVGEYIRALIDSGFLTPNWGTWRLYNRDLKNLNLPADVIDVVLKRTENISIEAKTLLKFASLWGGRFPALLLAAAAGLNQRQTSESISEALRENLIERANDLDTYSFIHDRINEAFLKSLDEKTKALYRRKIAEKINVNRSAKLEYIYELADLHRLGEPHLDFKSAFDSQLAAGQKALKEFAANEAYNYFKSAFAFAQELKVDLSIEFYSMYAQSCVVSRRYPEALKYLNHILDHSTNSFERARVYNRLARIYQFRREIQKSWESAMEGLFELGLRRKTFKWINFFPIIFNFARGIIMDNIPLGWSMATGSDQEKYQIAAEIFEVAAVSAYFLNDPIKFISVAFPSLYLAVRLGFAIPYVGFAAALGVLGLSKFAKHYMQKSIRIAEQAGDPFALARGKLVELYIMQFRGDWTASRAYGIKYLKEQSQYLEGNDFMNATYGGISCMTILAGYQTEGLEAMELAVEFLNWVEQDPKRRKGHPFLSTLIQILASKGRIAEAASYIQSIKMTLVECPDDACGVLGYNGSLLGFYYETDEIGNEVDEAIEAGKKITPVWAPLCMPHFKFFYVFAAYARVNQYFGAKNDLEKKKALIQLMYQSRELRFASMMPSWTPIRAHSLVIRAIVSRIKKNFREADLCLDRALKWCETHNLPWVQFECYRQRAHILNELGNTEGALIHAKMALNIAEEFHWELKIQWIQKEFALQNSHSYSASKIRASTLQQSVISADSRREGFRKNQQLDSLVQMCLTSIGVIDLKEQTRKLLDDIIGFFGAERGFVFITSELDNAPTEFLLGRGNDKTDIAVADQFSSKAIQNVIDRKTPMIFNQNKDDDVKNAESVLSYNLRSIIAAPLIVRDQLIGAIYLDNRSVKGIFQEKDKVFIISAAGILAAAIQSAKSVILEIERKSLQKDLELTGAVQSLLMPKNEKIKFDQTQSQGHLKAAAQASGDWWWSERLPDDSLFVFLGDVTGHGPASAMVTSIVSGIFHAVKHTVLSPTVYQSDPGNFNPIEKICTFFSLIDRNLSQNIMGEYLMCYAALHWDKNGKLTTWGAGSPSLLLVSEDDNKVEQIACFGSPFGHGVTNSRAFKQVESFFGRILMYSDGFLEIKGIGARNLSERDFTKWLVTDQNEDLDVLFYRFKNEIERTIVTQALKDDVTFVLIEKKKPKY